MVDKKLIELLKASPSLDAIDDDGYAIGADHLISNDVLPVVRCKDCESFCDKHSKVDGSFLCYWCSFHDDQVQPEDFCSYAKRWSSDE